MNPKNNTEFLRALFGDKWPDMAVSSGKDNWGVKPAGKWLRSFPHDTSNYYCVSTFTKPYRRGKSIFNEQLVLVVDDVGTKIDADTAAFLLPPPTYKIESSPGNFQWGFVFKEGCSDRRVMDALVDAAIDHEVLNPSGVDPGMKGVTRMMRLPYGVNEKVTTIEKYGKPIPCRITEWSPQIRYSVDELACVFSADLSEEALEARYTGCMNGTPSEEEIAGDFVMSLFRARGMIVDESRNDEGFIAVECPWSGDHTDGRTEAGYRPGLGGFKCHHGHCCEKGMNEIRVWAAEVMTPDEKAATVRDAFPPGDEASADAEANRARSEEAAKFSHAIYIEKLGMFGIKKTGCLLDASKFNGANPQIAPVGSTGQKSAASLFINSPFAQRAYTATYAPGAPKITTQEINGVTVTAFNTWLPGPIKPFMGAVSEADIDTWIKHIEMVLPDDEVRNLFYDFGAFLLQRPGKKINWGCLFQGPQGVGKDAMTVPLTRLLGAHNVKQVGVKALESDFNDHLKTQLVVIEELPPYHKKDIYETLKAMLSLGQGYVRVNEKNQPPYWIPNTQNYIVFSNHKDALAIEPDDRRFLVYFSPAVKQPPAYYTALFKALDDVSFLSKVYTWLLARDISAFNPMAAPPMTESKKAMAAATRGVVEDWIDDQLGPDGQFADRRLITVDEILKAAERGGPGNVVPFAVARKITARAVSDVLKARGAVCLGRFRSSTGTRIRPWALKSPELYAQMTLQQIDENYLKEIKMDKLEELKSIF